MRTGILWGNRSPELHGKNVTDEDGITDVIAPGVCPGGAAVKSTIRPRTIGLSPGLRS